MTRRALFLIAAASLTLLALEIIWTRIFSAEFFYTFAFLVLSVAVMGLGLGALTLRLFPSLRSETTLGVALTLTGLFALAAPVLVFELGVDFQLLFGSWSMLGKVVLMIVLLSAAFFFGGLAIAWILQHHHAEVRTLYAADLIGAGGGVLAAVWAMNRFGTPAAVFLSAVPVLVAALVASRRWLRLLPVVLLVAVGILVPRAPGLLEVEREERAPVVYKHWDALAKVKMYAFGTHRGLNIDNVANTPLIPFDGDWDAWYADSTNSQWDIDVGYLMGLFDACTFLSLGAGGGMDVMQALDQGAAEVHAVEVNGHINDMLLVGDPSGYVVHDSTVVDSTGSLVLLPEFTGRVYHDPRVHVVAEDARTYVRRHPNTFDVIYSLSSNTWAALGSGAFALTESYLFTKEAFRDYWLALTDGGFLSMEHQVYMPRLVAAVMDALGDLGVENPTDHFAVYNLPRMRRKLLLLSKRPLTDELRYRAYGELTPEHLEHVHPLFPAPDSLQDNLINQIVSKGWHAVRDSADVNISPCSDDRPFVAQMGLWRGLRRDDWTNVSRYAEFRGFPMSKLVLISILAIVLVLVLPLTLLPHLRQGPKLRAVPWLYFFLIGMAFMSVEVVLIQKYNLFMGASVYSLGTVLLVLLVASGVGSRVSGRVSTHVAFLAIVIWLLLDVLALRHVTGALASLPLAGRIAVTAVLIAPVGFFMGMPFPKAALRVGPLVDWGFAVNGVASVLGATLIVLVAVERGFTVALLMAAVLYLVAYGLLLVRTGWNFPNASDPTHFV